MKSMREYIVGVLERIGLSEQTCNGFGVLVSLIELCACRPELELSEIIEGYAQTNNISRQSVEKTIERSLNVYDADKLERISSYTNTNPITHKDALYDIAVTVSVEYIAILQKR